MDLPCFAISVFLPPVLNGRSWDSRIIFELHDNIVSAECMFKGSFLFVCLFVLHCAVTDKGGQGCHVAHLPRVVAC